MNRTLITISSFLNSYLEAVFALQYSWVYNKKKGSCELCVYCYQIPYVYKTVQERFCFCNDASMNGLSTCSTVKRFSLDFNEIYRSSAKNSRVVPLN